MWHTKDILRQNNVNVLLLPSKSPHLSSVKSLWDILGCKVSELENNTDVCYLERALHEEWARRLKYEMAMFGSFGCRWRIHHILTFSVCYFSLPTSLSFTGGVMISKVFSKNLNYIVNETVRLSLAVCNIQSIRF